MVGWSRRSDVTTRVQDVGGIMQVPAGVVGARQAVCDIEAHFPREEGAADEFRRCILG